jgi:hypothetical protein
LQQGSSEIAAKVPERSLHVSAALPPNGVAHAIDPTKLKQAGEHCDQQDRHARQHQPISSDTSDPIEHRSHYSFQIWSPGIDWNQDFTSSLQNGGHFTNTLHSHPNFSLSIAVHHCSSTKLSRGDPMRKLAILIFLIATATVALPQEPPKTASAQSDAKKAFEKMKTLAGSWQGTVMDIPINFTIRTASSGTAILHEGDTSGGGPPKHEITMFYLEGDRLLATHYCDAGNRSRWEGKMSPDGKVIEFSFLDVAGSTRGGYLKDMVLTMIDADHHIVGFTFVMPDGKPIQLRGEFQRTK